MTYDIVRGKANEGVGKHQGNYDTHQRNSF